MILDTLNKEQEDFLNSCYQLFLEQQQKQNKKKPQGVDFRKSNGE